MKTRKPHPTPTSPTDATLFAEPLRGRRSAGIASKRQRKRAAVPHLKPLAPSPSIGLHHPFGAYPYLVDLPDGSGCVLVYVDYTLDRPRDLGITDSEDHDGPITVLLAGGIGAKFVERTGPGWLIWTVPFAGVRWIRDGQLLHAKVDAEERLRLWLDRLAKSERRTRKSATIRQRKAKTGK